ncbi:MAG: hypothetical protein RL226_1644 [Bacteroidota bacterium]
MMSKKLRCAGSEPTGRNSSAAMSISNVRNKTWIMEGGGWFDGFAMACGVFENADLTFGHLYESSYQRLTNRRWIKQPPVLHNNIWVRRGMV